MKFYKPEPREFCIGAEYYDDSGCRLIEQPWQLDIDMSAVKMRYLSKEDIEGDQDP